jgi:hypothetical protein
MPAGVIVIAAPPVGVLAGDILPRAIAIARGRIGVQLPVVTDIQVPEIEKHFIVLPAVGTQGLVE